MGILQQGLGMESVISPGVPPGSSVVGIESNGLLVVRCSPFASARKMRMKESPAVEQETFRVGG
jgi:hypothetical protein